MKSPITVSSAYFGMAVQFGARRGLDVPAFLSWLDVDPATLSDPDARLPHEKFAAALDEISDRIHAPNLGLELAGLVTTRPSHADLGVLAYIASSSATLGDAFAGVIRYLRVVHDGGTLRLETEGDEARLFLHPRRPIYLPRHARECMLASMLERGRRILGQEWNPRVVRFEHSAPADDTLHRAIFRAPLEFDCSVSEMRFDRAILDRPVISADPTLHAVMARYAETLIGRLPGLDSPTDRVRQSVAQMMRDGVPDIERVARELGTSVRSLQRILSAEGLSFRRLVDDVRRDLALKHVRERRLTLLEIAFLLGFSDSTTFHRAFRRWTGIAPGHYRRGAEPGTEHRTRERGNGWEDHARDSATPSAGAVLHLTPKD